VRAFGATVRAFSDAADGLRAPVYREVKIASHGLFGQELNRARGADDRALR